MPKPTISIIVAAAENNAIGKDNQLLWHLPNDLKFFKRTTSGHTVIMGRKTYESVGMPLPNRRNIVITRQDDYALEDAEVVHSLEEALALSASDGEEIFIVGGAQIYEEALPLTEKLYFTRVHGTFEGEAFFPHVQESEWELISKEEHKKDEKHDYAYTFLIYERV